MKKSENNTLKNKKLLKQIIDIMIPASDDKILPKATDAVNLNKFFSTALANKNLKKELEKINFDFNKNNLKTLKHIEYYIGEILIHNYFSSRLVKKQLYKKISVNYPKKTSKTQDYNKLLKLVKNSSSRYKDN
tara:strand:- start:270 stop:668 length:399 start_codon:yes stop_codon:yes gene_type:complete